jgi:hypothetical protein
MSIPEFQSGLTPFHIVLMPSSIVPKCLVAGILPAKRCGPPLMLVYSSLHSALDSAPASCLRLIVGGWLLVDWKLLRLLPFWSCVACLERTSLEEI